MTLRIRRVLPMVLIISMAMLGISPKWAATPGAWPSLSPGRWSLPLAMAQTAAPPPPQGVSQVAWDHYLLGAEAYQAQDFDRAAAEFKLGYGLSPRSDFLYNWAQAERRRGDCVTAVPLYQTFLGSNPSTSQERAKIAADNLAYCQEALKKLPQQPEPAVPASTRPPQAPSESTTSSSSSLSLGRKGSAADYVPWYKDWAGGILLGSGVAALGVGVAFFVLSSSHESSAQESRNYGTFARRIPDAQTERTVAIVGLAVGSALVTSALVRYLTRSSARTPTAWMDRNGAGLALAGAF